MIDQPVNFEPVESPSQRSFFARASSILLETLQTILLALVLYLLIDSVMARVRVETISMQPTLHPGDFLLVNKLAYRLSDIARGDIVVFHYPPNPQEDYVKRVIGVAGDEIRVEAGKVWVNGHPLKEPYIAASPTYFGSWQVPADSIFVLGDNRNQSSDSHSWGFVPIKNVVGRAIVIYWPLDKVTLLNQSLIVSAAE